MVKFTGNLSNNKPHLQQPIICLQLRYFVLQLKKKNNKKNSDGKHKPPSTLFAEKFPAGDNVIKFKFITFFKRYVYVYTQHVENILITAHKVKIKTNRISLLDATCLVKAFKELNVASYFPKVGFCIL